MVKISSFTFKGYNDKPQPCLEERCEGMVKPTYNANVGRCDSCETKYGWGHYFKQKEKLDKSKETSIPPTYSKCD